MSSTEEQALAEMTKRLDSLVAYKRGVISQLKALNQRGKEHEVEFGKITDRLRTEREQLNQLFPRLKEDKEKRSTLIARLKEHREQARKVGTYLRGFEKSPLGEDEREMVEKLNGIEWKLQTQRLTREEERELVEHVKGLEAKLRRYKKVTATRQEYNLIMDDVTRLGEKIDEIDTSSDEVRNEIGKRKEAAHQLVLQREQILNEIKEHGKVIGELRQQLDKAYAEFEEIRKKRNELIISMKARDSEMMFMKKKAFLEKAKDAAKSKLEAGMSLSFDELRLAFDEET